MTDQERSSLLSQMAINDGLRNKPIKQMLEEKECEINRLRSLLLEMKATMRQVDAEKDQRIVELTQMLDEAMAVFKAYVNVPEANALRDRWERLKSGWEHRTLSIQVGPRG